MKDGWIAILDFKLLLRGADAKNHLIGLKVYPTYQLLYSYDETCQTRCEARTESHGSFTYERWLGCNICFLIIAKEIEMKRINLASLILGLIVLNGGNIANAATCGSVSLTPSDSPQNTGTVDCVAYGPGNLELNDDNELVLTDSIEYGSLNGLPGVLTPVSGISFDDNSGEFTILNTVWSDWSSIFIGIKEANGQAGGGWGLFSLTEAILDGSFATKLQARHSGTGFSHYFAIGGDPGPAPDPVPVPAAVWLFGSGLLGLIGAARRKSAAA